jgi:hypothetical protein
MSRAPTYANMTYSKKVILPSQKNNLRIHSPFTGKIAQVIEKPYSKIIFRYFSLSETF